MRLIVFIVAMLIGGGAAVAQSWREYSYPNQFFIVAVKDSVLGRIDDFTIGVVVARAYVGGQLRKMPPWLFALGVTCVAVSALEWDLTSQDRLPAITRAFLNLTTSTGFACALMSSLG